jgi:hypothetical protein
MNNKNNDKAVIKIINTNTNVVTLEQLHTNKRSTNEAIITKHVTFFKLRFHKTGITVQLLVGKSLKQICACIYVNKFSQHVAAHTHSHTNGGKQ